MNFDVIDCKRIVTVVILRIVRIVTVVILRIETGGIWIFTDICK